MLFDSLLQTTIELPSAGSNIGSRVNPINKDII
jgi:hypothetical protein